jgi:hypothetical protein
LCAGEVDQGGVRIGHDNGDFAEEVLACFDNFWVWALMLVRWRFLRMALAIGSCGLNDEGGVERPLHPLMWGRKASP